MFNLAFDSSILAFDGRLKAEGFSFLAQAWIAQGCHIKPNHAVMHM